MFSIFRAVGRLLGATSAAAFPVATTKQPEQTQVATSAPAPSIEMNEPSTPPADSSSATASSDYRAAFNYAARPTHYARPVQPLVRRSSFGRPVDAPKSTADVAAASTRHLNNIPPPQVPIFDAADVNMGHADTCAGEHDIDMSEAPAPPTTPVTPPEQRDTSPPPTWSAERNKRETAPRTHTQEPIHIFTPPSPAEVAEGSQTATTPQEPQQSTTMPTMPSPPTRFAQSNQNDNTPQTTTPQSHHVTITPTPPSSSMPRHPLSSTASWVDEIVQETGTLHDPLPENYTGTFRRIRYYAADYTAMLPCGSELHHHLLCGHYIGSALPCGRNCKDPAVDEAPFSCPACRAAIDEILNTKISAEETAKLKELESVNAAVFTAYCVELVTRALPGMKAGVADAVTAFLNTGYGRDCENSTGPAKVATLPLRQMVAEMQASLERKQGSKKAEHDVLNAAEDVWKAEEEALKAAEEAMHRAIARKVAEDALKATEEASDRASANARGKEKRKEPADEPIAARSEAQTPADGDAGKGQSKAKKMKTKLESHPEPITEASKGKKRSSSSPPSLSSSSAAPSSTSPSAAPSSPSPSTTDKPNKKAKHKFISHSEPITTLARGAKRSSPFPDDDESSSSSSSGSSKKQCTKPAPWGQIAFLDIPARLGAIVRRRKVDDEVENVEERAEGSRKIARLRGRRRAKSEDES